MRLGVGIGLLLAALAAVPAASAELGTIRRQYGELELPQVRAGVARPPAGHAQGRVRVLVTLKLPPLARAQGRGLAAVAAGAGKLDVRGAAAREYLARIAAQQRAAIAQLRRELPAARVTHRYQVVLNGFTVSLPATQQVRLARMGFVQRVWPSLAYTRTMNRGPSVIGADALRQATGADGTGIKIGVVDDGVDNSNPFLDGDGMAPPAGFPMGETRFTNGKVIVARSFPGPNSGQPGRLPLDRNASFHGTHVAGIAAGDAATCSPGGRDHPPVCALSGVAPRAWIGNYRVFNVPTRLGHLALSPEIAAAFEAAVRDGMDVINFSGGGPASDPLTDILITAVDNVAAAGVVPVISAGNDRDEFGFGSAGSPGTAPGSISVAAASNTHVFGPVLTAVSGGQPVLRVPANPGANEIPPAWASSEQILVDVEKIVGRLGSPVNRFLCGPGNDPNAPNATELPPGSLNGVVALAYRGHCTFVSKAQRAQQAGAVGLILIDNRFGEANGIPINLPIPGAMVADADGAALRASMGAAGRINIRLTGAAEVLETGRSGIITSFSSGGPTAFGHQLKPDVAAPGGQILSSTLREFAGANFAVFDGTSMAAPHVAGAAALLLQRHPSWTPQQVKSALVTTAGPAWADTARTVEAPVTLQGGGLVNLVAANEPQLFTNPTSLSFGDLNVNQGARSEARLVRVADAGGGAGNWTVSLRPQAQTRGVTVEVPPMLSVGPSGEVDLPVTARAGADAEAGDQMGFVVLSRGTVARRIPYYFAVTRPALESLPVQELRPGTLQRGDTRSGENRVSVYRFPTAPFGPATNYVGPPMNETGSETLYSLDVTGRTINFGAVVWLQSNNSLIHPWVLGSKDENDVQGFAGTPVNVNALTFDYRFDVEAAGAVFPRPKRYYVAVDSGSDPFTNQAYPGTYALRSWVNDTRKPTASLVTTRVAAGRPTIVARVDDTQAGVDPFSLALGYSDVLVGAALYDPTTRLAVFPLPSQAPALRAASAPRRMQVIASDFQEAKNVNTEGADLMPNTIFKDVQLRVGTRTTVQWLIPSANGCVRGTGRLVVVASSTKTLRAATFRDGRKRIATDRTSTAGLYDAGWNTRRAKKGKHTLTVAVQDASGRSVKAERVVRVCR